MSNRIFFKDNPFPMGHPAKTFLWSGQLDPERGLVFHFELITESYNLEDKMDDAAEDLPDGQSKIVWNNYNKCRLSSRAQYNGGIVVATKAHPFDLDALQSIKLTADPLPLEEDFDPEDLAFSIYLLGHDSCAGHRISITRTANTTFDIHWTGKIALTYAGDDEFRHAFEVHMQSVFFDGIYYPKGYSQEQAWQQLSTLVKNPAVYTFQDLNPKSFKREYKLVWTGV